MAAQHRQPTVRVDSAHQPAGASQTDLEIDPVVIHSQLQDAFRHSASRQDLLQRCHAILSRITSASLVAHVVFEGSQSAARHGQPVVAGVAIAIDELPPVVQERIVSLAGECCRTQTPQIQRGLWGAENLLVTMPVSSGRGTDEALVAIGDGRCNGRNVAVVMQAVAATLANSQQHLREQKQQQIAFEACQISELTGKVSDCDSLNQATQLLADSLTVLLKCRTVYIGVCDPEGFHCKLSAASGHVVESADPEHRERVLNLLDETVHQNTVVVYPSPGGRPIASMMFADFIRMEQCSWLVSGPLKTAHGKVVGVWLAVGGDDTGTVDHCARLGEAVGTSVASAIQLQIRAQGGKLQQAVRYFAKLTRGYRRYSWAALFILCSIAPLLPVPNTIYAKCELQPVVRRFIAAPFDATIRESFVAPGDAVRVDDLLARLDDRELRLEAADNEAALYRAAKQYDAQVATKSLAAAAVARLEMEQLKIQSQILTHRLGHIEIRSPLDGLIIAGDLKETEGVPVEAGQTLFEVAPLESMTVELSVAEEDLPYVEVDMPAVIHLEGIPGGTFKGRIARIRPRSELRDDKYVFIAELVLENSDNRLRPGMHGWCRVNGGQCLLGWRLLHRPWKQFVYWAGW